MNHFPDKRTMRAERYTMKNRLILFGKENLKRIYRPEADEIIGIADISVLYVSEKENVSPPPNTNLFWKGNAFFAHSSNGL